MLLYSLRAVVEGVKSLATPIVPFVQPLFVPVLYLILDSLNAIFSTWYAGDQVHDENDSTNPPISRPYDFIIGAGSAGSLLSNRLSLHYNVLLLEAGGEPNPLQFIPAFSYLFLNLPQVDWSHRTVPQRFGTLSSVNQQSSWSSGMGLGGSGNLNMLVHSRGHRRDFDNWAQVVNDSQWSWENVREYFKRHENYEIPGDEVNHGYRGELRVETPNFVGRAWDFVRAGMEMGYQNVDLNAPYTEGFDVNRYPIMNGLRQGPYKAFLEPLRFLRPTLTIMKFALVNKILFRDQNVAYGVQFERHGTTLTAYANREVIVSCGSVGTPKLLMLSGIGPRDHLTELNIPVISDVPVGQNLQDHLAVMLGPFFIREGLGTYLDRDIAPSTFVEWFSHGRGRLTNSGYEAVGLISSELAKARGEQDWPDLALFSVSFTNFGAGAEILARTLNLKYDEVNEYIKNDVGRDSLYVFVHGSRPFSRGFVKLGGTSPYDKPVIEPNYLGDPEQIDVRVLLDGVKKAMLLMENSTTMGTIIGSRFTTTPLPGCQHLPYRSDLYFDCFIRRFSVSHHDPVGTASMGSVVDTELRVFGVKNLRVVDASVQPMIVTTKTQASTLMIAEKAADIIRNSWNPQGVPINTNILTQTVPIPSSVLPADGNANLIFGFVAG